MHRKANSRRGPAAASIFGEDDAAQDSRIWRLFQQPIARRAALVRLYDASRHAELIAGPLLRVRLAILCEIADAKAIRP